MVANGASGAKSPLHIPAGMFVVHLRSDSDVSRQHLVGRVEHVMSGDSQPFGSVDALLEFMSRYATSESADG
jgi:hypothetical protein